MEADQPNSGFNLDKTSDVSRPSLTVSDVVSAFEKQFKSAAGRLAATPDPSQPSSRLIRTQPCPCCGGRMRIIETFERWMQPHAPPQRAAAPGAPP